MSEQDRTEDKPGRLKRLWRWFTLASVTPEADPVRSLSSFVVAVSTAILSFSTLRKLGQAIGLGDFPSYLFPIGFDFAVLAFTRAWLHPGLSKSTRNAAAAMAIFTITASVVGNSIEHLRSIKPGEPLWWTVTVLCFSALTPLVLGLVVHLAAMVGSDVRKRKADEEKALAKTRARVVAPVAVQPVVQEAAATGTDGITATVTAITGSPKERIRKVRADLLAGGGTIAHVSRKLPLGDVRDYSFAEVDRLALTNGYAKTVVPALEREEAEAHANGQDK